MSTATLHLPHAPSEGVHRRGAGRAPRSAGAATSRAELATRGRALLREVGRPPRNRQRPRGTAPVPAPVAPVRRGASPSPGAARSCVLSPAAPRPAGRRSAPRPAAPRPVAARRPAAVRPAASRPGERRSVGGGSAAQSLRLTRRGRLSLALGSTAVAMAAGALAVGAWFPAGAASAAGPDVETVAVHTTTVLPGQTLWEIAARIAPDEDRRDTILRILEVNGLDSAHVVAGRAAGASQRVVTGVLDGLGRPIGGPRGRPPSCTASDTPMTLRDAAPPRRSACISPPSGLASPHLVVTPL